MATPRSQAEPAGPPAPDGTDLLTYAEAGKRLRVHPRTVRNWANIGRLDRVGITHQVQRVTAASVERLIQSGLVST